MIKDSKYILKRILIGLGITICLMFIKSCNVHASVNLGGTTLTSSNYTVLNIGNRTLSFDSEVVYPNMVDYPQFFLLTMCADNQDITSWYINNNTLNNVTIYDTNYKCKFPNSSYTGGHIVYIYGSYSIATNCSASGTNCIHNGSLTFYLPNQSSWALLNHQNSKEEIFIDYSSNTIISQNQSIMNQNQEIIQQNENIYNMQKNESDETQQKLDNIDNTMKDSNIDSAENTINGASSNIATNGVISQLVTLPVTLFQKILNSLNGSCSSYNMGSLLGTDIILPCIDLSTYIGSTLWSVIDVLISGLLVWSISKKMIKAFNNFSTMKEGDVLDD